MEILEKRDEFGRKLTQVRVNWDTYMVPEYKVGDLVSTRWGNVRGVVRSVSEGGELDVAWLDEGLANAAGVQDYEVELVSPVD